MYKTQNDLGFGVIMFLVLAALGCWLITLTKNHQQTRHHQIKLFLIAMGVRFLAALAIYEFGLVSIVGDEDSSGVFMGGYYASMWQRQGLSLIDLPSAWVPAFSSHHQGYYYLIGTMTFLTGSNGRLPAAAMNCFFGAMTVVFAYRIARTLFSNWSAVRVGWLVCFFPSMIIWSCQTLKEPVVILLETVALYACVQLKQTGFGVKYILTCGAAMLLLYPFRFYAAVVTAMAVAVTFILPEIGKRATSTIAAGIAVAALVIPLAVSSGMMARSQAEIERLDIERIQKFRRDVAKGQGSGVETNFDMKTTSGFVAGTAVGAAHLLLAPFPWQLGGGSMRMIMSLPEIVVWWWLVFVGLIPGMVYAVKNKLIQIMPALIFIGALGLLYSMMFGNVGLIFRQRAQLLPWLLIFAVVGLEMRELKKILRRQPVMEAQRYAKS